MRQLGGSLELASTGEGTTLTAMIPTKECLRRQPGLSRQARANAGRATGGQLKK